MAELVVPSINRCLFLSLCDPAWNLFDSAASHFTRHQRASADDASMYGWVVGCLLHEEKYIYPPLCMVWLRREPSKLTRASFRMRK